MPEQLIPVEVTIDDLVPVMSGTDLIDLTLIYSIRYTDAAQNTIATRQASLSSFALMTQEQRDFMTPLMAQIKQTLHVAVVGE